MASNSNSVPPSASARQRSRRVVQNQASHESVFNLSELHAFFYRRFVEVRRPAEEEREPDVTSSPDQGHQREDLLEDAEYPQFSLFGHIYTDIPDTDSSSSSSTEEVFYPEVFQAGPGESAAVPPHGDITSEGPSAIAGTAASTDEDHIEGLAVGDILTGATTTAAEDTSINGDTVSLEPTSDVNDWLVYDPEEPTETCDPELYDSDQWDNMDNIPRETGTSANQDAVSTGNEGTTTLIYPKLPLERQIFPHGDPDTSLPEPFPSYDESYYTETARFNKDVDQAYTFALSKVADESPLFEDMSFRHHGLTPFAPRARPSNTLPSNTDPEFRIPELPSAWPATPARPRTSRFFPGGNTPSCARFATQNQPPQNMTVAVAHSMRSSEILGHEPSTSAQSSLAAQPSDPASVYKNLTREAVRRGRMSSADKKDVTFHAMTELLLDPAINDELRSKFSALSNDVLRLELAIFLTPDARAGNFLSPETIKEITPIAQWFIEYLGFLDQTLQREELDAQAVRHVVIQAASDQTVSLETRFRGIIRPIIRNLKRPRPAEHQLLQTFIELFDAYVYSDFLNIYNYQVLHEEVRGQMAVSGLLIEIWAVLHRTVGNHQAIMMVNDELKAQFITPAMGQVANSMAIWDDENAVYLDEVDGGVSLGV